MTSCIGHNHMPFLWCVFWRVLLDDLLAKMHNRSVVTCVASPFCGWACVFSALWNESLHSANLHICVSFHQCGWSCASSSSLLNQMTSHILSKCGPSRHCGWALLFSDPFTKRFVAMNTSVPPSFAVCYHVSLQISCLTKWLRTIWTEVYFFSILGDHITRHFVAPGVVLKENCTGSEKSTRTADNAWTNLNWFDLNYCHFYFYWRFSEKLSSYQIARRGPQCSMYVSLSTNLPASSPTSYKSHQEYNLSCNEIQNNWKK